MADDLREFKAAVEEDSRLKQKILDVLEQAQLDRETLESIRERQEWIEKIANAVYTIICDLRESQNALLEVLGGRLRKDSEALDLLRQELDKRALENGVRDLLQVRAGGDVVVDQSKKVKDGD